MIVQCSVEDRAAGGPMACLPLGDLKPLTHHYLFIELVIMIILKLIFNKYNFIFCLSLKIIDLNSGAIKVVTEEN